RGRDVRVRNCYFKNSFLRKDVPNEATIRAGGNNYPREVIPVTKWTHVFPANPVKNWRVVDRPISYDARILTLELCRLLNNKIGRDVLVSLDLRDGFFERCNLTLVFLYRTGRVLRDRTWRRLQ